MRNGFLGALGVWLAGVGLALAQQAPEYRPATGFYHPMAPAAYSPNGWMPQQQPGITYSQSMYQPGYPMQGYPQAYPQPMYYPQPAMARPMAPSAMPAQWVRPVGMTPPAAQVPYTITGPVVVPNRVPAMPLAEDPTPAATELALPAKEAVKPAPAAESETPPPPMLPSSAGPMLPPAGESITSAPSAPHAPVIVEHEPVVVEHDAVSEAVVEHKEQKATTMMSWLKAKKDRKADKTDASCDDNCDNCDPKKEKKKLSLLGKKKDKDATHEVVIDDEGDPLEPAKEKKHLSLGLGKKKKGKKGDYLDDDESPGCADCEDLSPSRFWFAVDYLGWLDKKERIRTPLLTSGPVVLLGSDRLDEDLKNGARLRMSYSVSDCWAIEGSGFGFLEQTDRTVIGSNGLGFPFLGRPIFDPVTGMTTTIPVAAPSVETGAMSVQASSRLYGGDANGVRTLYSDNHYILSALAGFRYLRLEEGLTVVESSSFLDGSGSQSTRDSVTSNNQFYGGQLGLSSGVQLGRFYVGTTAKGSVGWTQELTRSDGSNLVTTAGVPTTLPALLVVPGRRSDDGVAYVGEGSVEVACQITPHVSALVGWNFLYWNKVARPGDQLSNVLNRPVQTSDVLSTSFWTQGVTASLGVRF